MGNKLSKINTNNVNNPTPITAYQERCKLTDGTNLSNNNPNHERGAPGKTGRTDPVTPTKKRIMAMKTNRESSIIKMRLT